MKSKVIYLLSIFAVTVFSCSTEKKMIHKGNTLYTYINNRSSGGIDSIGEMKLTERLKAKIEDKTDYIVISGYKNRPPLTDSISVPDTDQRKYVYGKKLYYPEHDYFTKNSDSTPKKQKTFVYSDWSIGLQALTIPIKIRPALRNDTIFPSQVETGFNIGFAPHVKYNIKRFNPDKKFMDKASGTFSVASGLLLGLGATDLKVATNAPGLKSDRKSGVFSYGTFIMFGVNNINIGYAIGGDAVIGEGGKYWKYQGVYWQGVIIALDIIK